MKGLIIRTLFYSHVALWIIGALGFAVWLDYKYLLLWIVSIAVRQISLGMDETNRFAFWKN